MINVKYSSLPFEKTNHQIEREEKQAVCTMNRIKGSWKLERKSAS